MIFNIMNIVRIIKRIHKRTSLICEIGFLFEKGRVVVYYF